MICSNSSELSNPVFFFPQMKAEVKAPELTDSEKSIFDILKKEGEMDLAELKAKAGLSNKQWDKGMKGLNKKALIKVEVDGSEKKAILAG